MSADDQRPKLPRGATTPGRGVAVHDRDELVPKHPAEVSAVPRGESWEDSKFTPIQPTPVSTPAVTESPVEVLMRRSGETKNSTLDTLVRVETLRQETREDFKEVHAKVDSAVKDIHAKVDVLAKEFTGVRLAVVEHGVQNKAILDALGDMREDRDRTETVRTTTRIAEVEVDKTRQLTDLEVGKTRAITQIEDDKAAKALRRKIIEEFVMKVVIALLAGGVVVLLAIMSKCGK